MPGSVSRALRAPAESLPEPFRTPCYSRAAMRLIITEKNNSAKKIAEILSGGEAKDDATYKVPFYTWTDADGEQMAVGLKGHVMGVAFPEGYSNWQETDLHELIDAELVAEPTDKNVVKAVRKLAKERRLDRDRHRLRPRGRADRPRGAASRCSTSNPEVADGERRRPAAGRARPLLGADQGRDRARLLRTSTSSPTTSPTPAPRARTST